MSGEPSREKKQAMIAFAKWVRGLLPGDVPEYFGPAEIWNELSPRQRKQVKKKLLTIDAME